MKNVLKILAGVAIVVLGWFLFFKAGGELSVQDIVNGEEIKVDSSELHFREDNPEEVKDTLQALYMQKQWRQDSLVMASKIDELEQEKGYLQERLDNRPWRTKTVTKFVTDTASSQDIKGLVDSLNFFIAETDYYEDLTRQMDSVILGLSADNHQLRQPIHIEAVDSNKILDMWVTPRVDSADYVINQLTTIADSELEVKKWKSWFLGKTYYQNTVKNANPHVLPKNKFFLKKKKNIDKLKKTKKEQLKDSSPYIQ